VNVAHNLICSSRFWSRRVEHELVPWALDGVELGDEVLEIGPGFGLTTRLLARRDGSLEVLELEESYCRRLREELGDAVTVTQGDATALPYSDNRFSGTVCFTMLHHIPSAELQDAAFAEVVRVLRPGGTFAGTDSRGTGLLFKLIHIGDTLHPIDPDGLPARLEAAGLVDVKVDVSDGSLRFRARKPGF
jgi:ubiquinone/menaquinone biosynthesis C-methylase UbiE